MVCWTTRRAKSAHSASRTPSKKPSNESSLQGCPRASRIGWRSAASSVPLNSKDSKRREGVEGNQIIFEFRSLRRSKDHRSVMLNSKDADRREGLEGNQISFELRNLRDRRVLRSFDSFVALRHLRVTLDRRSALLSGCPLFPALQLRAKGISRGAVAQDPPNHHADQQHRGNEDEVRRRHLPEVHGLLPSGGHPAADGFHLALDPAEARAH